MNFRVPRAGRTTWLSILIPFLAFLALSAWALSSPVGASPDEDYHLASIWCGQGFESAVCEEASASDERRVPETLPNAAACYAFQSEASAACQNDWFLDESKNLVGTDRGNFTGDYPPAFYYTMNFLVGDDISKSVMAMRLFNAALFVGMITLLYRLLPRGRRPMLVVGTAVALVPLGVFVIPSINPSGWAVISSAVVFPAMVGFFESTGRRRLALGGVAALGIFIGAGARADAAVYAAIAVVLAALVSASWRKGAWKLLACAALACAACALVYLTSGQNQAASAGLEGNHEGLAQNYADLIGQNLLNVPELWAGSLGFWGLGWLDTQMPSLVWVTNLATFGGVLYLGIRQTNLRKSLGVSAALVAVWALPTWVLVQSSATVGMEVQPRYLLPLLVVLAQVALYRVDTTRVELSRSQLTTIAAALTLTSAISLHFNIRRYVTGTDVFEFDLNGGLEWWWAVPLSPMAVWFLGAVTFGAAVFLCAIALASNDAIPESDLTPDHDVTPDDDVSPDHDVIPDDLTPDHDVTSERDLTERIFTRAGVPVRPEPVGSPGHPRA